MDKYSELKKLKDLLDKQILTEEEYEKEKEKILGYKSPAKKIEESTKVMEVKENNKNLDESPAHKLTTKKNNPSKYSLILVSLISLFLIFYFVAEDSSSLSSTTTTLPSTTTTLPTTTSTLSDSEKQKIKICRSKKNQVLKKVTTTFNILDDAFDQVVFIEDNGFKFEPAIQKLEDMNFFDFRNPQDETERRLDEIEQLLGAIMPTAIYGLEIYYEGYKQFLRDGNDSRAESTYLQGDPYMDASFDEVSEIREKINKINC